MEWIFKMTLVTLAHLFTWSCILSGLLWLVRPEMGAEWILGRGCTAGAIISAVICVPFYLLFTGNVLATLSERRQRRQIQRAVDALDTE